MKTVLLIGTLDTKGHEIAYLRERLRALGYGALVLDSGILGEPLGCVPDISRAEVARAAGYDIDALRTIGTRGAAVERMIKGVEKLALELFADERCHGLICLGGAEGAVLGASAAKALPIGVPKIIVSPIASGVRKFGPLIGRRDVMVVHSLIDILGINPISRTVFDNVVAAMAGMLANGHTLAQEPELAAGDARPYVAATMLGNTTRGMMVAKDYLAARGYETVIFHSNGVGGPIMEELLEQGLFSGVIDYTLNELSEPMLNGFQSAPERLEKAGALGLPQVVVTGCVDFACHGPRNAVPEALRDRPAYYHNPEFTLIRLSRDEQAQVGATIARKLNAARGPVELFIPLGGVSIPDVPGGAFYDPEASLAFREALLGALRPGIPVHLIDAHINDPPFATAVADAFLGLLAR
ncbi:MAG TPA: Tm-1-like ATP-binding domain-containing protein [Kouleothrix sp.]|uniref:Tm-1-like ATP-binding domain-containing protein n=1 Tax=Kouleothrix sp. TaxID=2779161 RepID=UPI002BE7646E|nr:Tm-1-like ATP-binding domain-containing protein [Kouleothrix sp.]HRC75061.1 Tm-1-like ATP-binding domain-containing protein [Kouleothrix sp.]